MKLSELNPKFLGDPVDREGVGLACDCPCGCGTELFVPFSNPLDGGQQYGPQGWERTGETFDTLTLSPSIQRYEPCPNRWHGFIRDGEIVNA
jgi:hypothetical protein